MAYIGRPLQVANLAVQSGTGDGSDTTPIATLDYATTTNGIAVYLDGVRQLAGTDYNVTSQTTLTFTTAPANGVGVDVYFLGLELSLPTPADGTVSTAKIAANAVDETKLKDALVADFTEVVVTASDSILLGDATDSGNTKRDTVQGILDLAGGAFESQLLHVEEHQATNTNAGTFTSGADRTRILNTVMTNEISGASLASNQITLPAGKYICDARAPAYNVTKHRVQLYNVTGTAVLLAGTAAVNYNAESDQSDSWVSGKFTLSGTTVVELQHRCNTTVSATGFGVLTNFAPYEVYAVIKLWKVE